MYTAVRQRMQENLRIGTWGAAKRLDPGDLQGVRAVSARCLWDSEEWLLWLSAPFGAKRRNLALKEKGVHGYLSSKFMSISVSTSTGLPLIAVGR